MRVELERLSRCRYPSIWSGSLALASASLGNVRLPFFFPLSTLFNSHWMTCCWFGSLTCILFIGRR
ncbi:hypothetical protein F5Y14DRAFT_423097 [Nemania sp. NC0429]|nr:hypothetical protein F5Y14DRAFT_423097 [Nemania sp. NC0429]